MAVKNWNNQPIQAVIELDDNDLQKALDVGDQQPCWRSGNKTGL